MTGYNTGTTAGTGSAATSQALTIPAGVLSGDGMLLLVTAFREDGSTTTIEVSSTGSTFEVIGSPEHTADGEFVTDGAIYSCTATSGDPDAVITAQGSGSPSVRWVMALVSYTGLIVIDVSGGAENTLTCPSLTTGAAGDWAIYFIGTSTGTANTLAGATVRQDTHPSSVDAAIADSNGSVGSSGTGIGGGTWAQGPAGFGITFTVGLAPAGGAAHSSTGTLTVSPALTADATRAAFRGAALTSTPSFTADATHAATIGATLAITPSFTADATHAATIGATLAITPVMLARGGHPAAGQGTNLNQDQALYAPAAAPPLGAVFLRGA